MKLPIYLLPRGVPVAPHAGAWIETQRVDSPRMGPGVAPHAGAWIETHGATGAGPPAERSPPTRGRGLKRQSVLD